MLLVLLSSFYALVFQEPQTLKNISVNVSVDSVSVRQVLTVLEEQSGYRFFYNSELFNGNRKVSFDFRGSAHDALMLLLGNNVSYVISGKHIQLQRKVPAEGPTREHVKTAGDYTVSGIVSDNTGMHIPGAYIVVNGTAIGSTTNAEGRYTISVPDENATLIFSFIGYKTKAIEIKSRALIDVSLENDETSLDEVVVIGYGSVRKSDLTGSISTISKQDIGDRQVSDVASLIQGRATGVDVSQGTIRIRGITSFNNTDPLIVIDGFTGGNLATLNPNDIENIEILKDASSTAIYGVRGANGVIVITTKMGKQGPMSMNIRYNEGVSVVPGKVDVMNANQYTDYALEILKNSGQDVPPKLLSGETRVDRTNWQDAIFKTGHNREINVDFSGGADKASYYLSLGYRHVENPTFRGLQNDLIYLSNKNTFTPSKWLRIGSNFSVAFDGFTGGGEGGNPGNLETTLTAPTYIPLYDANGQPSAVDRNADASEFGNPYTTAIHNHIEGDDINFQSILWGELQPLKGLTYKIVAGVSGSFGRDQYTNDEYSGGIAGPGTLPARITKVYHYRLSPLIEQYITYNKIIGSHNFSLMVGNTVQRGYKEGRTGVRGQDYDPQVPNVTNAQTNFVSEDYVGKYAYLSYYTRLNYQFANKYLMTINVRSDASPKFPKTNRWGAFPAVALAWKIHEENFLKSSAFDELKLRVAWGISGNDAIGDFLYQTKVHSQNVYYPFGPDQTRVNGATVLNSAISDLRWESTRSQSVGIDMMTLNGKLTFTGDYYFKKSSDVLYEVPRAISLGYGSSLNGGGVTTNAASLKNTGIELQLGYRSTIGKLGFNATVLYTHNENKVTSLGEGVTLDGINRTEVGHPIGYFYGFVADGIFMTQRELDIANTAAQSKGFTQYQLTTTQAGDVRFKDINGDGHVDNNDRTNIGNSSPTNLFGLNTSLAYLGFDLNFLLQGISGSKIYEGDYGAFRSGSSVINQSTYILNRWRDEEHPGNGIVPRAVIGDPAQNNRPSTLRVSDGDYLKLKQISLGYTLSSTLSDKIGISKLRFYLSGYNLATLTKFKYDFDPEVGGANLNRGLHYYNFPRARMMMLGMQVSF